MGCVGFPLEAGESPAWVNLTLWAFAPPTPHFIQEKVDSQGIFPEGRKSQTAYSLGGQRGGLRLCSGDRTDGLPLSFPAPASSWQLTLYRAATYWSSEDPESSKLKTLLNLLCSSNNSCHSFEYVTSVSASNVTKMIGLWDADYTVFRPSVSKYENTNGFFSFFFLSEQQAKVYQRMRLGS